MSTFIHRVSCFRALSLTLLLSALINACGGGDGSTATTTVEPHTWTATQSMLSPRVGHTATLLKNGKVLIAGGKSSTLLRLASAELYDPKTATWTETGSMSTDRAGHTATLLANGDVLVAGGDTTTSGGAPSVTAEIYDSSQGTWTVTGSMSFPRAGQAAVLLQNGYVLVAGGATLGNSAELYDSATGSWTTVSNPGDGEYTMGANLMTLLPNGAVLAILSYLPQLYDPNANVWTPTNPIPDVGPNGPFYFNLTNLTGGTFLIAGGTIDPGGTQTNFPSTNTAFTYAVSTDTWTATGNMTTARADASASLLQDGTVLVFGGTSDSSSELFDPTTGTWSATGNTITAYSSNATATVLPDGRVLVTGGVDVGNDFLSSAEIYNP